MDSSKQDSSTRLGKTNPPAATGGQKGISKVANQKVVPLSDPSQDPVRITAEVRLANDRPDSKSRAFADVTIPLGPMGEIRLFGFSVLASPGKPVWIAPPARKGKSKWFETVLLRGDQARASKVPPITAAQIVEQASKSTDPLAELRKETEKLNA